MNLDLRLFIKDYIIAPVHLNYEYFSANSHASFYFGAALRVVI
ncbi:MAG: hypothetical protein IRD7MM_03000 [Candidatus Midichloria mitochondrii]